MLKLKHAKAFWMGANGFDALDLTESDKYFKWYTDDIENGEFSNNTSTMYVACPSGPYCCDPYIELISLIMKWGK